MTEIEMREMQINSLELQKLHGKILTIFANHFGELPQDNDVEYGRIMVTCIGALEMVKKTLQTKCESAGVKIIVELSDGPIPGAPQVFT